MKKKKKEKRRVKTLSYLECHLYRVFLHLFFNELIYKDTGVIKLNRK